MMMAISLCVSVCVRWCVSMHVRVCCYINEREEKKTHTPHGELNENVLHECGCEFVCALPVQPLSNRR